MPALRICLVAAALLLTALPGSWARAEDTLPVPARPGPPAEAPVPVAPPAAEAVESEPVAPVAPGPILYDPRSPFGIPTESVKDAHWASSITGPRVWAPAPPTPPRWSKPFVRSEPEPEPEPTPEPEAEPGPGQEPQPAVRPAPDADLPPEPVAPNPVAPAPAPGPTGR